MINWLIVFVLALIRRSILFGLSKRDQWIHLPVLLVLFLIVTVNNYYYGYYRHLMMVTWFGTADFVIYAYWSVPTPVGHGFCVTNLSLTCCYFFNLLLIHKGRKQEQQLLPWLKHGWFADDQHDLKTMSMVMASARYNLGRSTITSFSLSACTDIFISFPFFTFFTFASDDSRLCYMCAVIAQNHRKGTEQLFKRQMIALNVGVVSGFVVAIVSDFFRFLKTQKNYS